MFQQNSVYVNFVNKCAIIGREIAQIFDSW